MNQPVYDFKGKVAIVTGAGGGMGEAIATALAKAGAVVTGIDMKPCPDSLSCVARPDLCARRSARSGVCREDDTGRFRHDRAGSTISPMSPACCCSGATNPCWIWILSVWDDVLDINLRSIVLTSRAAAPLMRRSGGGSMVHFSTIQWMRGDLKPQDAYQASKAAVSAVSRSLAMQLASDGIRSNTICPGPTLTPLQARWDTTESAPAGRRLCAARADRHG